jgi:hypothetical protein
VLLFIFLFFIAFYCLPSLRRWQFWYFEAMGL